MEYRPWSPHWTQLLGFWGGRQGKAVDGHAASGPADMVTLSQDLSMQEMKIGAQAITQTLMDPEPGNRRPALEGNPAILSRVTFLLAPGTH